MIFVRWEISEFGGLESCLLSRWRKLEGIKEGVCFSEHDYGLGVTKLSAGCQEDGQAAELSRDDDGQSACVRTQSEA